VSQQDAVEALKEGDLSWTDLLDRLKSTFGLADSTARKNITDALKQDRIIQYKAPHNDSKKKYMYSVMVEGR
jgi:hypothetical protein